MICSSTRKKDCSCPPGTWMQDKLCTTLTVMLVLRAGTAPMSQEPTSCLGSSTGTQGWKDPGAPMGKVRGTHTGHILVLLVAPFLTAPQAPVRRSSPSTSASRTPTASVSGVLLFPIYPLSPGAIISRYNLHCHCYSDDVQIILTFLFHLSRGFF